MATATRPLDGRQSDAARARCVACLGFCLNIRRLLVASLPIPRVLAGRVPRIPRYYQGTATSCRPSRRTSLPSFGGTTVSPGAFRLSRRHPARSGGPGVGHPVSPSVSFSVETTGTPKFLGNPNSRLHMIFRPGPADASLTLTERSHGPREGNDEGTDNNRLSRLNSMAFGLAAYVSRGGYPPDRARLAPGCW